MHVARSELAAVLLKLVRDRAQKLVAIRRRSGRAALRAGIPNEL